ncbi:MAG: hypothetical protein IT529_01325 [Burkholderiales bacterium]|nr:hypothetical protein [Burkholderiales bacterium]
MELVYVLAAAVVIALPFALPRLFAAWRTRRAAAGRPRRAAVPLAIPGRPDGLRMEVASLLSQGGKLEAIRLVRERKGLPLADARIEVETIAREEAIVQPAPGLAATIQRAQEMSEQVRRLAARGRKSDAVKLLREKSGIGLKEAKDLVDRLG